MAHSAFMHAVCFCPARDARLFLQAAPGQARISSAMPPAAQDGVRVEEALRPPVKRRDVVRSQSDVQAFWPARPAPQDGPLQGCAEIPGEPERQGLNGLERMPGGQSDRPGLAGHTSDPAPAASPVSFQPLQQGKGDSPVFFHEEGRPPERVARQVFSEPRSRFLFLAPAAL